MIIDGRKIRDNILTEVKKEVLKLSFVPVFCDVIVGDDLVSKQYVEMKAKTAEKVGIKFHKAQFPDSISTEELIEEIRKINNLKNICGSIIQLPLPEHLDKEKILNEINSEIDVDCLGKLTSENFYNNKGSNSYPAASACLYILNNLKIDLFNKKIVIIGQGRLVGRPLNYLLKKIGLNPEVINKETKNKELLIREADVIISAVGQGKFIDGKMVKDGVIIIDAGTSEENGSIVGDVDLESVLPKVSKISPVPGGVGPVTVAMLLKNILEVAKSRRTG